MGWVGMYWGIRWCYGVSLPRHSEQELMITQIQGILGAVSCVLNAIVLRETRGDVLLLRRAIRLTRETGRRHATAAELQKKDFLTLMKVSLIRPFRASILPCWSLLKFAEYLFTEPIVSALSTWMGFAWAIIFLGGTSELLVFRQYGFNDGEAGSIQMWVSSTSSLSRQLTSNSVVLIGAIFGFISNLHQDHLYAQKAAKHGGRAPPEARLYWAAYGGLLFPLATFAFAWTGRPDIPWPVPAMFLCLANWGEYVMYSGILYVTSLM